jgi:hypothetical protein
VSRTEGLISRCTQAARHNLEIVSPKLYIHLTFTNAQQDSFLADTDSGDAGKDNQRSFFDYEYSTDRALHQARQIRTLIRNSNRLSEPDRSRRVIMYSRELPSCLVKQVTKMGYRAFLAVEINHHLWCVKTSAEIKPGFQVRSSYHQVDIVCH